MPAYEQPQLRSSCLWGREGGEGRTPCRSHSHKSHPFSQAGDTWLLQIGLGATPGVRATCQGFPVPPQEFAQEGASLTPSSRRTLPGTSAQGSLER